MLVLSAVCSELSPVLGCLVSRLSVRPELSAVCAPVWELGCVAVSRLCVRSCVRCVCVCVCPMPSLTRTPASVDNLWRSCSEPVGILLVWLWDNCGAPVDN